MCCSWSRRQALGSRTLIPHRISTLLETTGQVSLLSSRKEKKNSSFFDHYKFMFFSASFILVSCGCLQIPRELVREVSSVQTPGVLYSRRELRRYHVTHKCTTFLSNISVFEANPSDLQIGSSLTSQGITFHSYLSLSTGKTSVLKIPPLISRDFW